MTGDSINYVCLNAAFTIRDDVAICADDGTWTPSGIQDCVQSGKTDLFDLGFVLN